jgi:2-dehydropantoate 2-reductase
MMEEARAVAEALGVEFSVDTNDRIEMAAKVGHHRSSMLQDVDARRATELDCLLGAVIELAKLVGIATPTLDLVYDLAKFRSRT